MTTDMQKARSKFYKLLHDQSAEIVTAEEIFYGEVVSSAGGPAATDDTHAVIGRYLMEKQASLSRQRDARSAARMMFSAMRAALRGKR